MTLNIKDTQIAGLPAVQVRNMLRRADYKFTIALVEDQFGVSASKANKILQALSADGYIQQFLEAQRAPQPTRTDYYGLTDKGEVHRVPASGPDIEWLHSIGMAARFQKPDGTLTEWE